MGQKKTNDMGLRELKTALKKQNKEQLIKHISELYKKYKPVKEYFDFYLNPDEDLLLEEYRKKLREGFYPTRGDRIRLSISRKAISDFKKLDVSNESNAALMLYFVECGVELTNEYGDIDEQFYSSIENTFANAIEMLSKEGLLEKYEDRAKEIVDQTAGMGWGFHDILSDICHEYYGE